MTYLTEVFAVTLADWFWQLFCQLFCLRLKRLFQHDLVETLSSQIAESSARLWKGGALLSSRGALYIADGEGPIELSIGNNVQASPKCSKSRGHWCHDIILICIKRISDWIGITCFTRDIFGDKFYKYRSLDDIEFSLGAGNGDVSTITKRGTGSLGWY